MKQKTNYLFLPAYFSRGKEIMTSANVNQKFCEKIKSRVFRCSASFSSRPFFVITSWGCFRHFWDHNSIKQHFAWTGILLSKCTRSRKVLVKPTVRPQEFERTSIPNDRETIGQLTTFAEHLKTWQPGRWCSSQRWTKKSVHNYCNLKGVTWRR